MQDFGSLISATGMDPESQLDILRSVQQAHEAYTSALSELKKADVEFSEKLARSNSKVSRAELVAYTSAVSACVQVAGTLYSKCPDLPCFRVARTNCKAVSNTFEAVRAHFETMAGEGQLRTATLAIYRKALTAFVDGIGEAQEMVASAITGVP